jgi:hypothetical protein
VKYYVPCFSCEKSSNATEVGIILDRNPEHGPSSLATLMECDTCGGPLLFLQEDYGEGVEADAMVRVWPGANRHLSSAIPKALRDVHGEARRCFNAKVYTAAVVMVGRTLEGVCQMNGIKE